MDSRMEVFKSFISGCTDDDLPFFSFFDAGIRFPDIEDFTVVANMIVDELISRNLPTYDVFTGRDLVYSLLKKNKNGPAAVNHYKALISASSIGLASEGLAIAQVVTDTYNAAFSEDLPDRFKDAEAEVNNAPDVQLPQKYSWSPRAELLSVLPNGDTEMVYSSPIYIKELRISKETGDERLCIAFQSDGEYKYSVLEPQEVYDGMGLRKLNSRGAVIPKETAKKMGFYFVDFMRELRPKIKRQYVTSRIGWINENYDEFMPYESQLLYDETAKYQQEYKALLKSKGSLDGWTALIGKYRDENHIPLRILLAASFASVLVKRLSPQPFFVHLWGPSGIGKTPALRVAASVWASPIAEGNSMIRPLRASIEALDQLAQFYNNLPICLDDRENTASSGEALASIVYNLSTGAPKTRALGTGGLREQEGWCNAILTTGEHKMVLSNTGGGAENRILEVHTEEHVIESSKEGYTAFNSELDRQYNTAGREFIKCLLQKGAMDEAETLYHEYEKAIQDNATGRQTGAAAIILTADTLVAKWIFKDSVKLTPEDIIPFLKSKDDIDQALQIHKKLYDWIIAHPFYFDPKNKGTRYGQRVVRRNTGKKGIAFIPDMLEKALRQVGGNLASYLIWAKNRGYLEIDASGVNKITVEFRNAIPNSEGGVYEKKTLKCFCLIFDEENQEPAAEADEADE